MVSPARRQLINAKRFISLFVCIVLSTSLLNISKASADVIAGSPYLVLTFACGNSGVIFYPSGASNPVSVGATMTPVSNIAGSSIVAKTISSLTVTDLCSTNAWSGVATSGTVTNSILTKMAATGLSTNTTTLTSTLGVSVGITQYATFSTSSAFAYSYGINRVSLPSATPAFTLSSSTETVNAASAIVGYTITSTGGAIDSYSISPAISNGLSFSTTTGLISGITTAAAPAVTYTITATNTAGSSTATYSLTVNAAPSAPALNSVTSGDRRVTVAFTAGANNGAAITDYEYSLNGGTYVSAGTTTSPFTITGLSGRTTYSVTIKARNSVGLSTASSSISATTTDASRDASEATAAAEAAKKAKEQKELTELLSVIPSIAGLALNLGDLTNSLLTTKCVKGKTVKYVKKGAKCPRGFVKKK